MQADDRKAMQHKEREHAVEQLDATRKKLHVTHPQTKLYATVRDGNPDQEIDAFVGEVNAELLALGAHGKTRWEAGMLGSTTQDRKSTRLNYRHTCAPPIRPSV